MNYKQSVNINPLERKTACFTNDEKCGIMSKTTL